MKIHKIDLPFELAPELIYEKKNFLVIDSKAQKIHEIALGDNISIFFFQKVFPNDTESPGIITGDMMIVEVHYIEVIYENLLVVSIKPKSYTAHTFSINY